MLYQYVIVDIFNLILYNPPLKIFKIYKMYFYVLLAVFFFQLSNYKLGLLSI